MNIRIRAISSANSRSCLDDGHEELQDQLASGEETTLTAADQQEIWQTGSNSSKGHNLGFRVFVGLGLIQGFVGEQKEAEAEEINNFLDGG